MVVDSEVFWICAHSKSPSTLKKRLSKQRVVAVLWEKPDMVESLSDFMRQNTAKLRGASEV